MSVPLSPSAQKVQDALLRAGLDCRIVEHAAAARTSAEAAATLIDRDLLRFGVVHAAGGTPNAMFPIRPADLVRVSGGTIADVALLP